MKIGYDQIKKFLNSFESSDLPVISTINLFQKLNYSMNELEDCNLVIFYLNLLKDQGLIECVSDNPDDKNNLGFSYTSNSQVIISNLNFRLTILGHQALESMANNHIWNKIKEPLKKLSMDSLKQIPSLAIKLLIE